MKKFRLNDGRMVAYVHQNDIRTLASIKRYVVPELFQEQSVLNAEVDLEGYLRIERPESVQYLQRASFIPDYDTLNGMDYNTLDALSRKAIADRKRLNDLLVSLCDGKKPLTPSDRKFLCTLECVDRSIAEKLEFDVIDSIVGTSFREMSMVLDLQSQSYTSAIVRMADLKEANQVTQPEDEKKHILRRVFPGRKKS